MPEGPLRDPCGILKPQILTSPTGIITSPNYPQNYGHGEDCRWLIKADEDNVIELTYDYFSTERGYTVFIS